MVANAYSTAALSGAPMQQAVDVIEPLRAVCMTSTDAYDLGDAFVAAILKVVGEPLLPIAQNLRDRRNATIAEVALQLVADEILAESGHAEHEWLRAFGEALAAYELTICSRLIEGARESSIAEGWIPRLDAATNAARQESWAKFGPAIDLMLAEDIWEDVERAPLLAMQSQIQLYIFENGPEARRLADEAVRRAPGNVRAIEALAYVHLNAGRREEAEGLLLEAVESQPNSGLIQAAYSYCAEYSGDTDAAEERLLDGLRQAPYSSALITRMLNLYCTEKFFVVRETRIPFLAAQVVAVDPDAEYGIYLVIARAHSKNKQSDGARDILNRLVATNPGRVEAHVELARLELADGRAEVSKAHLRDALAVDPVCLDAATVFAEVCDALHDVEGALEWNSRAVSWTIGNPGLAEASLALRQAVAGMDEAAWASATRAVGAAPDDGRITDLLAEMISARWTTNPDDVRSLLRIVLDNRGEKFLAEYHNLVGIAAYQAQDNNSAVSEFHTALELAPDKAVYHSNLGRALRELGRWDEARERFDAAFAIDDDEEKHNTELSRIYNERGNAAFEQGLFDEAAADYEDAVRYWPDQAVFHGNLSLALQELSENGRRLDVLGRAVDALTQAARLDPEGDYNVRLARTRGRLRRIQRFGGIIETVNPTRSIIMEFGEGLVPLVDPDQRGQSVIPVTIPAMQARFRERLGFDAPTVLMRGAPLGHAEYRILFFGAVYAAGTSLPDFDCVIASPETLAARGVKPDSLVERIDAVTGSRCSWATPEELDGSTLDGLLRLSTIEAVFRHLEDQLRRNAGLFFNLDMAERWVAATTVNSEPHAENRSHRPRSREQRKVALARALRACVQDQIRLDASVLSAIEMALDDAADQDMQNPLQAAIGALQKVRSSMPERLPEWPAHPLPEWAETVLESTRCFTPVEEHELLLELESAVQQDPSLMVLTRNTQARAYVQRLLEDRFGTLPGVDIAVVTRNDTEATDDRLVSSQFSGVPEMQQQ